MIHFYMWCEVEDQLYFFFPYNYPVVPTPFVEKKPSSFSIEWSWQPCGLSEEWVISLSLSMALYLRQYHIVFICVAMDQVWNQKMWIVQFCSSLSESFGSIEFPMQLLIFTCRFLQRTLLELFEPELKLASVAL